MTNKFNTDNPLLDYDQVKEILSTLCNQGLSKQKPLGHTSSYIPIDYYKWGNGPNHIILTGATHGCEIITTDFLLHFMSDIVTDARYKYLSEKFTLHFVPVVNPEGYIITTSAMRKLIKRDTPVEDAVKISKQYFDAYRQDDIDSKKGIDRKIPKLHQIMFSETSYQDIPDNYPILKHNLKRILDYINIPKGSMITWSSNGNGIDPNANVYNHPRIKDINEGKMEYATLRYNNININAPGPLKCPNRVGIYVEEPEVRAVNKLVSKVKYEGNLCGVLIYHSTWGKVFYEPFMNGDSDLFEDKRVRNIRTYNTMLAQVYAAKANYELMGNPGYNYVDEDIRLRIPGTLLIELSKMGGNPIGPYGDLTNYEKVINDNMKATISTITACGVLKSYYDKMDSDLDKEIEETTGYARIKL